MQKCHCRDLGSKKGSRPAGRVLCAFLPLTALPLKLNPLLQQTASSPSHGLFVPNPTVLLGSGKRSSHISQPSSWHLTENEAMPTETLRSPLEDRRDHSPLYKDVFSPLLKPRCRVIDFAAFMTAIPASPTAPPSLWMLPTLIFYLFIFLLCSSICPPLTAPCTDSIMELASEMKQWIRYFTHSSQVRYKAPEFWRTPKLLAPKPMRGNTSCMLLVPYWKRQTSGINKGNTCVSITAQEAV